MIQDLTGTHAQSTREATRRLNLWTGAVSSGKTVTSLLLWLEHVHQGPAGNLLMVGKTERTLERNVLALLAEWLPRSQFRHSRGAGECVIGGRTVWLVGASDARAEGKIRGSSLVGAYGDEITLWPEDFWKMLLSRLRQPGARLYGTTNPDHPRHWLKKDWLDRAAELDLGHWHLTIDDNPTLDPTYVQAIKAEYTGLWYQRYIDGVWVAAEGAVYPWDDQDRARIIAEPPDSAPVRRWTLAVDYGTTNPLHALLAHLSGGRLWIRHEWRWDSARERRQLTDADYSTRLRLWCDGLGVRPERVVYDPSAASFGTQLRQDGWAGVTQADNAVLDGIRLVARLASPGVDRLRISPSCTHLLDELEGYRWDPKASAEGRDEPLKQDDHGVDSLRYCVQAFASSVPRETTAPWV